MSIGAMAYIVASLSLKTWYESEKSKYLPRFIADIDKYGYPKIKGVSGNEMVRTFQVNIGSHRKQTR